MTQGTSFWRLQNVAFEKTKFKAKPNGFVDLDIPGTIISSWNFSNDFFNVCEICELIVESCNEEIKDVFREIWRQLFVTHFVCFP